MKMRHFRPTYALFFALLSPIAAQTLPDSAKKAEKPSSELQDPLNRQSPQSSVIAFLESCRAENFERAARYLDLSKLSTQERFKSGPALAKELGRILDRDGQFDVASMSTEPAGYQNDNLPPDRERIRSYKLDGGTTDVILTHSTTPRSGIPIWVFSAETVEEIPTLMRITSDSPIEKYLPAPLVTWTLLGSPIWRWIAMAGLAIAAWGLSGALALLLVLLAKTAFRRWLSNWDAGALEGIVRPVRLLLAVGLFSVGVEIAAPSALVRLYLDRLLTLLAFFGVAWLLVRIVDLSVGHIRASLDPRHSALSRSALPLAARITKTTILILAAMAVLGAWGYSTTTILAGLGIGGIAVALAAQKTIENLFGGVAVISDHPVMVGDFCKFGDRVGTVEDIGLRSTRIRTLDRTLVTVPNAEFASMVLENYSWRDKMWFHPILNITRDTSPDQLRQILSAIRRILKNHPKVEAGDLCVRFVGAGEYSLNIETFAYVKTPSWDEYLVVQQELWLQILDAVADAGSSLALPTQVNVGGDESAVHNGVGSRK